MFRHYITVICGRQSPFHIGVIRGVVAGAATTDGERVAAARVPQVREMPARHRSRAAPSGRGTPKETSKPATERRNTTIPETRAAAM